jgi:hypothetical protein
MNCSWMILTLAGLGALALASIAILSGVALGLRCSGAGLFDRFLPPQSPDGESDQARGQPAASAFETKLTVAEIARELLNVFDLDDGSLGIAMESLHNRVRAQEGDQEVATKMLQEGFLIAVRESKAKELREFERMKFESFLPKGKPN